ncbi:MAG TPA: tripartite tricarboxylate transporter substrate binding protein [Xanthobacteraceae bacterium]|jgi:tripartite-type tricarboxylate transporter receptor subunit TctC
MRRTLLLAVITLAVPLPSAGPAAAQSWPTPPVSMVVPFAPGGSVDVMGRILAARLSEVLGQQVIVENIPGAGGMLGSARVAKAMPDGHEFVLGIAGTHAQNQTLYKHPLYDAATDFAPVALIAEQPTVLVTRKDLPPDSLPEFIAYAKANQAKMQYGSAGAGSANHLACVLLNADIGANVTHVPFRGGGPAMQELLGGRIDYMCNILTTALPQIEAKTVKPIALLAARRSPILPSLASAGEQGLPNFDASTWYAVFLPKGTPAPIVHKLHDAIEATVSTAAVQERLKDIGADLVAPERRSPDYLAKFVVSEIARWAAPIKASGVSMD